MSRYCRLPLAPNASRFFLAPEAGSGVRNGWFGVSSNPNWTGVTGEAANDGSPPSPRPLGIYSDGRRERRANLSPAVVLPRVACQWKGLQRRSRRSVGLG